MTSTTRADASGRVIDGPPAAIALLDHLDRIKDAAQRIVPGSYGAVMYRAAHEAAKALETDPAARQRIQDIADLNGLPPEVPFRWPVKTVPSDPANAVDALQAAGWLTSPIKLARKKPQVWRLQVGLREVG